MKLKIRAGTTSLIARIFVQDTTRSDGSGLPGLTSASAGLAWYYSRVGDAGATAVTASPGTVGAYTNSGAAGTGGGFVAVDGVNMPGVYEVSVPDAALAAGSTAVHMMIRGAANMAPVLVEVELDAVNYQSNTAFVASVPAVANVVPANLTQVGGAAIPATSVGGVLKVDVAYLNGSPAAAASGAIDANLVSVNGTSFGGATVPGNTTQWAGANVGGLPVSGNVVVGGYATGQDPAALMAAAGYTAVRAGYLDTVGANLDAKVSSRSTYAGGPVAGVTAPVTVGTVNDKTGYTVSTVQDKTGYSLAPAGLDAVPIETGVNARQALSPILAASAGVILGAGTGTVVIKGGNTTATRITASTDNAGNRTNVTLALPV